MSRDEVNATVRNAKHKLNKTEDRSKGKEGTGEQRGGRGNYACQVSVRYFLHNLHSHANELGQH